MGRYADREAPMQKEFVACEMCKASVRVCNIALHMAKAHGMAMIDGEKLAVDAKNPSEEDRRRLSRLYLERGLALNGEKKHKEAVAFFQKALEYDERSVPACLSLAVSLETMRQYSKTEEVLGKALAIEPSNEEAMLMMADYLRFHGKSGEAVSLLSRMKEPANIGKKYEKLAYVLMQDGQLGEAKRKLAAAWPELRQQFESGHVERDLYLRLGSILFTLFAADHGEI